MSTWGIIGIFILVFGIIVGNLLLVKQSAKQKMPEVKKDNNKAFDEEDDDRPKH